LLSLGAPAGRRPAAEDDDVRAGCAHDALGLGDEPQAPLRDPVAAFAARGAVTRDDDRDAHLLDDSAAQAGFAGPRGRSVGAGVFSIGSVPRGCARYQRTYRSVSGRALAPCATTERTTAKIEATRIGRRFGMEDSSTRIPAKTSVASPRGPN